MVNQPQDTLPIVKCRELSYFLFHSELWGLHICVQNWMGMVSFLSSPFVETFFGRIFTCQMDFALICTVSVGVVILHEVQKWT